MDIHANHERLWRRTTMLDCEPARNGVQGMSARQRARADALAQMIDLLDLLDADCDLEVETDCCAAGDDMLTASPCLLGSQGDHGAYDSDQEWSSAGVEL